MGKDRSASFFPKNPLTYDGNGKIHDIQKARGIGVVPDKTGQGFRLTGVDSQGKLLANSKDASFTKILNDNAELRKENEKIKKTNEDTLALVKDMKKRLDDLEGGK